MKRLQELPATTQPAFAWHGLSNAELREHHGLGNEYERCRRAFLGIQEFNAQQGDEHQVYPTPQALAKIADCDTETANRYWVEPLSRAELNVYSDALAPMKSHPSERTSQNITVTAQLGKRLEELVQWPKDYD